MPGPSDVMKTDSQTDRQGFQSDDDKQKNVNDEKGSNRAEGAKTIKGELFRIEDGNYFVKVQDGKEVRLHTDKTTQMARNIKPGDRIEAKVNDQNHALSILSRAIGDGSPKCQRLDGVLILVVAVCLTLSRPLLH